MLRKTTAIAILFIVAFGVSWQLQKPQAHAGANAGWPYSQFAALDRDKPVLVELGATW